jgi:SAM-dependent methyltransferase
MHIKSKMKSIIKSAFRKAGYNITRVYSYDDLHINDEKLESSRQKFHVESCDTEDVIEKKVIRWLGGIDAEIRFWLNWFETSGGRFQDSYRHRTSLHVDFAYPDLLEGLNEPKVLDVGSGPISVLGDKVGERKIDVAACDPLAFVYADIMRKFGVRPYRVTEFALSERLTEKYPSDSFDIVHMRNALDHSINPMLGVYNMLDVCKIKGLVLLEHAENEAEYENYAGLHQWNISKKDGDLIFWNRDSVVNVSHVLEGSAEVSVTVVNDGGRPWITAKILKCKNAVFDACHMNIYDRIITKTAFLFFSKTYRQLQQ